MEILIILAVVLAIIVVVGHCTWLLIAWFIRQLMGSTKQATEPLMLRSWRCLHCSLDVSEQSPVCIRCGTARPSALTIERLKDLAATERQLERFERTGKLDQQSYSQLQTLIESE